MRFFTFISLSAFLLISCGCGGGVKAPEDLRNLCPVLITVKNGDQPMTGIQVVLLAKAGRGAYACTGVTGNDGVALIRSSRSSYTGKGAPAGTYAVVLSEPIDIPQELISQEADQDLPPAAQAEKSRKLKEYLSKNQLVPSVLTSVASPVELAVAEKTGATLTVDITQYKKK